MRRRRPSAPHSLVLANPIFVDREFRASHNIFHVFRAGFCAASRSNRWGFSARLARA